MSCIGETVRFTRAFAQAARALGLTMLLAMAHPSANAADSPEKFSMTWMMLEMPPFSMPSNGQPTTGLVDIYLKRIMQEWPQAEHRILAVNQARGMSNLAEGVSACFAEVIYTPEREKTAYFTLTRPGAVLQLVVRVDVAHRLARNDQGEVLPATLFDRADLRGILVAQRSYSVVLDALLALRSPRSAISYVHIADSGANILRMINLGRADYTLEYEPVLNYHQNRLPELRHHPGLVALPLAATVEPQLGIACPHTEWGRTAVQRLDAILARMGNSPDAPKDMLGWMSPSVEKRFHKEHEAFFRQRAQATDPAKFLPWPHSD